jgi:predicted enzyme related to lactoylglutathione lyase
MITHIGSTTVYVSDQDKALNFYVQKLGFDKRRDEPMGPDGPRWIEVAPPRGQTALVLYKPTEGMSGAISYEVALSQIGTFTTFILNVDDMQATYQLLRDKGVEFVELPTEQLWGWWATIKDPDGNIIGLHD